MIENIINSMLQIVNTYLKLLNAFILTISVFLSIFVGRNAAYILHDAILLKNIEEDRIKLLIFRGIALLFIISLIFIVLSFMLPRIFISLLLSSYKNIALINIFLMILSFIVFFIKIRKKKDPTTLQTKIFIYFLKYKKL